MIQEEKAKNGATEKAEKEAKQKNDSYRGRRTGCYTGSGRRFCTKSQKRSRSGHHQVHTGKIINVSDLSTFEAIYNGIAKVANEKDPEKIDYYVSYEATIRAGIDFTQVKIEMDDEAKTIAVYLPNAQISADGVNVDITSLDYIFINKRANSSTVSQQAYKACIQDATQESRRNGAILTLADENAQNIIEALIQPFVQQLDAGYQLEINTAKEGA